MPNSYYFFLGMFVFISVSLTIIFRLEKRMVWPYGELEPTPPFDDPNGYAARCLADAEHSGFVLLGWMRDIKGGAYRVGYAMLVSPERDIFAVIGVGKILKLPLEATWLHTPAMNGQSFYSTDRQVGVQVDVSRHWTNQLVPEASFGKLLQRHREWIANMQVLARPFTRERELAEFRALREEHCRSMERAGLIRFTDPAGSHFYYTFAGAAKTATWSYVLGVIRGLSRGAFPRSA